MPVVRALSSLRARGVTQVVAITTGGLSIGPPGLHDEGGVALHAYSPELTVPRGRRTANTVSASSERASIVPPCARAISRAM